jgi:hypothetical protein
MPYPYDWSDEQRGASPRDRDEEEARRAAQRRAELARTSEEREWDRGRRRQREGDYAAGWWGEEAARDGYVVPGPYGRPPEQRPAPQGERAGGYGEDAAFYRRYDESHAYDRREQRLRAEPLQEDGRHRTFEDEARHAGRSLARGWRRLTEGARHTFEDDRGPAENDPRRAGGMFGGQDRPGSLFNHDDGLGPSAGPGSHRGKGPKGYVRGDERILEEVCDRLTEDDRLDACDIEVKVDAGEVTLNGQVKSREDKRRAEDVAESVSGVRHLQNNLRVRPPAQPPQQQAAPQTSAQSAKAKPASKAAIQSAAPTSAQIEGPKTAAPKSAAPKPGTPRPN